MNAICCLNTSKIQNPSIQKTQSTTHNDRNAIRKSKQLATILTMFLKRQTREQENFSHENGHINTVDSRSHRIS